LEDVYRLHAIERRRGTGRAVRVLHASFIEAPSEPAAAKVVVE